MSVSRDLRDSFGLGGFLGMRIIESPDLPRYTLPADVPPPRGMTRAAFAAWSREVCGVINLVPPGQAYVIGGHTVHMNPRDVLKLSNL